MRRIADVYVGLRWQSLALVAVCALLASSLLVFSRPIVMMVDGERVDTDVRAVSRARPRADFLGRSRAGAQLSREIQLS